MNHEKLTAQSPKRPLNLIPTSGQQGLIINTRKIEVGIVKNLQRHKSDTVKQCDPIPISPISDRECKEVSKMQLLTPEEVIPHLCYIAHSGYAHTPTSEKLITPFGYQPVDPESIGIVLQCPQSQIEILEGSVENSRTREITKTEKCFVDRTTGLKILVSVNRAREEIILAFGDANSLLSELKENARQAQVAHYKAATVNFFGAKNCLYKQANYVAMEIIYKMSHSSSYKNYSFMLTGQSLGGSLAQFVGLSNRIQSMCYNAMPLGKGQQELIGIEKLEKAHLYITHLTIESDYVNRTESTKMVNNFGNRYTIPTAYTTMQATHSFILGSAMKYLGENERTLPHELIHTNPEFLNVVPKKAFIECYNRQTRPDFELIQLRCVNKAYKDEVDNYFLNCIRSIYKPKARVLFSIFDYSAEDEFSPSRFINDSLYKMLVLYSYASNNARYQECRFYQESFYKHIQNWILGCADSGFNYNLIEYSNDFEIKYYNSFIRLNSKLPHEGYLLSKFMESYILSKKFIEDIEVSDFRNQISKLSTFFRCYQHYSYVDSLLKDIISNIKYTMRLNSITSLIGIKFLGLLLKKSNLISKNYIKEWIFLAVEQLQSPLWQTRLNTLQQLLYGGRLGDIIPEDYFNEFLLSFVLEDLQHVEREMQEGALFVLRFFVEKYNSIPQDQFERCVDLVIPMLNKYWWQAADSLRILCCFLEQGKTFSDTLLERLIPSVIANLQNQDSQTRASALRFFMIFVINGNVIPEYHCKELKSWVVFTNLWPSNLPLTQTTFDWITQCNALVILRQLGTEQDLWSYKKVSLDLLNYIYWDLQNSTDGSINDIERISPIFVSLSRHPNTDISRVAKDITLLLEERLKELVNKI